VEIVQEPVGRAAAARASAHPRNPSFEIPDPVDQVIRWIMKLKS
jgi:hypothetical protein